MSCITTFGSRSSGSKDFPSPGSQTHLQGSQASKRPISKLRNSLPFRFGTLSELLKRFCNFIFCGFFVVAEPYWPIRTGGASLKRLLGASKLRWISNSAATKVDSATIKNPQKIFFREQLF